MLSVNLDKFFTTINPELNAHLRFKSLVAPHLAPDFNVFSCFKPDDHMLLAMYASVSKGLLFLPPGQRHTQVEPTETGPKCSFLGVGDTGARLWQALVRLNHQSYWSNESLLFQPEDTDLYLHLLDQHLIFIAGEVNDQKLWTAHELAASADPKLLITFAFESPATTRFPHQALPNECRICIENPTLWPTVLHAIQDVYTSISLPGLVCLDFSDIRCLLSGKGGYLFTVECGVQNQWAAFSDAVKNHQEKLGKAEGVFCFFTYDHRSEEACTMDMLGRLSEALYTVVPDDSGIIWGANVLRQIETEFRAVVIMV